MLYPYPMIAVILISRRVSEYFDLNQKDLRQAAVKSGRIVQILRELFRFTVRKPCGQKLGRRREVLRNASRRAASSKRTKQPAKVERTELIATAPSAIPDVRAAAFD